jgi:hypothetical protein
MRSFNSVVHCDYEDGIRDMAALLERALDESDSLVDPSQRTLKRREIIARRVIIEKICWNINASGFVRRRLKAIKRCVGLPQSQLNVPRLAG